MLSTLLLTFACAAPAQEPAAPLVDLLPADSFVVVEASLEPWDRLRKQTRAHAILRGQDILKTTLSVAAEMGMEQKTDEFRAALGAVRFSLALTPASLDFDGALLLVEPIGLASAGIEWTEIIQEMTGVSPVKFGNGHLALMSENMVDAEAIAAYLASVAEGARSGKATLGSQAQWASLHRQISSRDDLMRITVPGWNLKGAAFAELLDAEGAGSPEESAAFFDQVSALLGLQHGLAWATSIQGTDVIDRVLLPRDQDEATYWSSLGPATEALDQFGKMKAGPATATAYAIDMPAMFGAVESLIFQSMALEGQSMSDDPTVAAVLDSLRGIMGALGPKLFAWQSIEDSVGGGLGNYQVQVRDRAALESAWAKMPQEVSSIVPLLMMQFGAGPDVVELSDTMLDMRLGTVQPDGEPMAASNEFKQMRSEIIAYLDGAEPILIQTLSMEMDRLWLTEGGGLFEAMELMFGIDFGVEIKPEQLKSLRPIWAAGKRTERGIEIYARSTFGFTASSGLAGVMQMMLMGQSGPSDDFDEEEF